MYKRRKSQGWLASLLNTTKNLKANQHQFLYTKEQNWKGAWQCLDSETTQGQKRKSEDQQQAISIGLTVKPHKDTVPLMKPINQVINYSANQLINQPTNQPINHQIPPDRETHKDKIE